MAMASETSDTEIDALLARGRLAGPARDEILGRVLEKVRAQEPRTESWPRRVVLGLVGLAAVATAAVVVPARLHAPETFRAKGASGDGIALDLGCEGGSLDACPVGSTLIFGVNGETDGFLAAYAEPRGGGERIWYFSSEGEAPRVHAEGGTTAVRRAVRVGDEHQPGEYVVHVVLSRAPLARAALLSGSAADLLSRRELVVRVVPRGSTP
jgi:hypothetical protein